MRHAFISACVTYLLSYQNRVNLIKEITCIEHVSTEYKRNVFLNPLRIFELFLYKKYINIILTELNYYSELAIILFWNKCIKNFHSNLITFSFFPSCKIVAVDFFRRKIAFFKIKIT